MSKLDYREFIEIDPEIRFGRPVLKNTRITVYDVLQWLASGMTYEEIIADFPQITPEHILASLEYTV